MLKLVTLLIIVILSVVFALQNAFVVRVTFLAWQFDISLALLLVITFLLGFMFTFLASASMRLHKKISHTHD